MVQDFSQTTVLNSHIQVVSTGTVHRKQFGHRHQRLTHFFFSNALRKFISNLSMFSPYLETLILHTTLLM